MQTSNERIGWDGMALEHEEVVAFEFRELWSCLDFFPFLS
jgi:hypothetical protein